METWRKRDDHNVTLEAVRLNEGNVEALAAEFNLTLVEETDPEHPDEKQFGLNVPVPEHKIKRASLGMYLVKYGRAFHVEYPRTFELVYEPANRPPPPPESIGESRRARGFADPFARGRIV